MSKSGKKMIIVENAVFSAQKIGGISVVWYELIKRLNKENDFDVRFIEYQDSENNILRSLIKIDKSKLIYKNRNINLLFLKYNNPYICSKFPFVFHSSDYRTAINPRATNFVTVHDFIYHRAKPKDIRGKIIKWVHCNQIERAVLKSDYVICISQNTKKDLLHFVPKLDVSKVHVIYNGVSDDYFPIKDKMPELPFPKNSYAMFVGSRSKYKNFELALEVVKETGLKFVVVGKKLTSNEQLLLESKLGRDGFVCLTNVDNSSMNVLYNGAFCLLFLSSYEGFGIPVIEAQKSGCPVIALNASSIPEIIGNTPLLLNEPNVLEVIEKIEILQNDVFRSTIVEKGYLNSKRFSWDKTYSHLRKLYVEAQMKINE